MKHPLQLIQNELSRLNCYSIITFFLKQDQLSEFEIFASRYGELRRDGKLANILGLAIEGPLLESSGGTPSWASWEPSHREWERISALGKHGLIYVVYSMLGKSSKRQSLTDCNILEILSQNCVAPALGQAQLTALAHKLNATPRKCLGFKTPAEVFAKILQEAA